MTRYFFKYEILFKFLKEKDIKNFRIIEDSKGKHCYFDKKANENLIFFKTKRFFKNGKEKYLSKKLSNLILANTNLCDAIID